ncbi:patatin-like phospholipase domain-containing protein 4 isoform X1 [Electrophorus electricus]|uniref:PNPLA domain-containing protein n=1 Tax=Electrophorus electricus TaxID=8005 RepID=A0A4W4FQL8_ELEEL|nr:patatin-like phospholipase domain-containing protein 4 isoform X1 [Electrophorus electricus]XP_035390843.1 patatin-like phospholipase domain-containing protein 4 isoform X1 [Electrophorus electricus]XP_035390844.1 patatin-like phospholipase domain-containing protein 4 isoform X1 [Electrophorus electricus]
MALVNLSFAACGFLGIYHLGVVAALLRHGDKLLDSLRACAGASAGALVAAVVVTAPDKLEHCKEFTYRFANNVRKQKLGALSPGYDFMLELRDGMEEILPPDAHLLANKCLHVSITHFKTGKNRMVSSFTTREDLIKVLLASSFVPVYAGMKPVEFQGQKWIDGGFTDGLPVLPTGRTITVSPFSGPQDICPHHPIGSVQPHIRLPNMTLKFSWDNIKRLDRALFPAPLPRMQALHEEGFADAVRFLRTGGWMR